MSLSDKKDWKDWAASCFDQCLYFLHWLGSTHCNQTTVLVGGWWCCCCCCCCCCCGWKNQMASKICPFFPALLSPLFWCPIFFAPILFLNSRAAFLIFVFWISCKWWWVHTNSERVMGCPTSDIKNLSAKREASHFIKNDSYVRKTWAPPRRRVSRGQGPIIFPPTPSFIFHRAIIVS